MWTVYVKTLAYALCDACPLTVLSFSARPTVQDVLDKLGQDPHNIKVLLWGEDELSLDASLDEQDSLSITTEHAQSLRREKHKADEELYEQRRQYITEHPEIVEWFDKSNST